MRDYRRCLFVGMVLFLWTPVSLRAEEPVRNLVIICLDTVRYDSFWWLENKNKPDPLSPWTKTAVRFRQVQSTAPWTMPAVASLFTGLYPEQHGAGKLQSPLADLAEQTPTGLALKHETIAETLKREGFYTSAIVSHPWFTDSSGLLQGFSEIAIQKEQAGLQSAKDRLKLHKGAANTHRLFLYLHFMTAHDKHHAQIESIKPVARSVAKKYPDIKKSPHYNMMSEEGQVRYLTYLGNVFQTRQLVATVLQNLSDLQILGETAVVVFSDHGEEFEDHLQLKSELGFFKGGDGHGNTLFQELLHVPVVVWHPAWKDMDIQVPASLIDVRPTVLGWLGIHTKDALSFGKDLSRLDKIHDNADLRDRALFSSGIAYGYEQNAVLWNKWKAILPANGKMFSFSLQADPFERQPVFQPLPEIFSIFLRSYKQLHDCKEQEKPVELTPEELEQLQGIGYLSAQ